MISNLEAVLPPPLSIKFFIMSLLGIGALLGGAASLISGVGGLMNTDNSASARNWQSAENWANRKFQRDMMVLQHDWQNQDWNFQQGVLDEQWYQHLDAQSKKDVDSALRMLKMYQSQGINLGALLGGSGMPSMPNISPSVGNSPNVPMQSAPSGAATSPSYAPNYDVQWFDVLSSAIEKGANTYKTLHLVGAEKDNILADARYKRSLRDYQEFANFLQVAYGEKEISTKILKDYNQAQLYILEGNKDKALESYYNGLKTLYDPEVAKDPDKQGMLLIYYKHLADKLAAEEGYFNARTGAVPSEIAANKASAAQSYATAYWHRQLGVTEDASREDRLASISLDNQIKSTEYLLGIDSVAVSNLTRSARVEYAVQQAKQQGIISDRLATQLRMDIVNEDWQVVDKWLGAIQQGTNIASDAVGIINPLAKLKSANAWSRYADTKERMAEFEREHYGDWKEEDVYNYQDIRGRKHTRSTTRKIDSDYYKK